MNKKYKLIKNDTVEVGDKTLYRIKSLKDFSDVFKGELGGYIEKESNLSHYDNCWVFGTAQVYGEAEVYDNALVYGEAEVYDNALVYGDAQVGGFARAYGEAWVYGEAVITGDARVSNESRVFGTVEVYGNADIQKPNHVVWFSNVGSENGTLTMFKTKRNIKVTRGCFLGTTKQFLNKSKKVHDAKIKHEYKLLIEVGISIITGIGK